MYKTFRGPRLWLVMLALLTTIFTGCGSSADDLSLDLTPDNNGVAHVSWGSYRLYRYEAGSWRTVLNLGTQVESVPVLGDNPVLVIHGLGSRIDTGKFSDLADNLLANGASSVFGFEYDSLDPIETNGSYLVNALQFLTTNEKDKLWRVVGHSMGVLVARSAFERGVNFDIQATDNIASLVAGPNLGSEVAAKLQNSDLGTVDVALQDAVLNGQLDFRNADNTPVRVTAQEPSFAQLVPNSTFLNALNANPAHPQWSYRTLAGDRRGDELEALDAAIGVFADDGIVNVTSANTALLNQVQFDVVPFDHVSITQGQAAILVILNQLGLLAP